MANYTNYHTRIKENISRSRDFKDYSRDGIVPERVIMANNDNIYYGTFAGALSGDGLEFKGCVIDGAEISNAMMHNVTFSEKGMEPVTTGDIVNGLNEVQKGFERIGDELKDLSKKTNTAISALSTDLNQVSGDLNQVSIDLNQVSGDLS